MQATCGANIASPLLSQICKDFIDAHMLRLEQANSIEIFCAYAAEWLKQRGIVGVGHTASGLALRFADGKELDLFTAATPEISAAGVPLTGTEEKISVERPKADLSVNITGR